MKPENILLKQQGRSGIKVGTYEKTLLCELLIGHKNYYILFWQLPYLHKHTHTHKIFSLLFFIFSFSFSSTPTF